jgi:hypothetical protein
MKYEKVVELSVQTSPLVGEKKSIFFQNSCPTLCVQSISAFKLHTSIFRLTLETLFCHSRQCRTTTKGINKVKIATPIPVSGVHFPTIAKIICTTKKTNATAPKLRAALVAATTNFSHYFFMDKNCSQREA